MNKKILFGALLPVAACFNAYGQNETLYDFTRAAACDLNGTARYTGTGGAMGAIGGDASSIGANPAAIGVYRSTEITASLNVNWTNTRIDEGQTGTIPGANLSNLSLIGTWGSGGDRGMTYTSLGVAFNRVASFRRSGRTQGTASGNSLTGFLADYTAGASNSSLSAGDAYDNTDLGWASILASRTGMISDNGDGTFTSLYQQAGGGDYGRYLEFRESGEIDNLNVALGGAVNNKVYWGLSIEADFLDYKYNRTLQETYADNSYAQAANSVNLSGTGITMKFGVIYKPLKWLRVGAAFHTPTWWTLKTAADATYATSLASATQSGVPSSSECALSSPLRALLAAGFVFNKGFIGVDYQFSDYTDMHAGTKKNPHAMNQYAAGRTLNTHTLRLGGEFKPVSALALRLGGGYTSPANHADDTRLYYVNDNGYTNDIRTDFDYYNDRGSFNAACGIGGRFGHHSIDLAYVCQVNFADYYSYNADYTGEAQDPLPIRSVRHQLLLSYGLRF